MKNGKKMRKVKNSKIYKEMAATYEAALKQKETKLVELVAALDKAVAVITEAKQEKNKTNLLLASYDQELGKHMKIEDSLRTDLEISAKSAKAWEGVANTLALENLQLRYINRV